MMQCALPCLLRRCHSLHMLVLLAVLFLTLRGQVSTPLRWRRKSTKCLFKSRSCHYSCRVYPDSKIASRRFPRQWPRMMQNTNVEQIVNSLAARATTLETNAAAASSGAQQALGTCLDRVTAPQPLGPSCPMAWSRLTTTETQHADLILFPAQRMNTHEAPFCFDFFCGQYHAGVSTWFEKFWATTNASFSKRLVFETRAK